jgi:hypothetical protein
VRSSGSSWSLQKLLSAAEKASTLALHRRISISVEVQHICLTLLAVTLLVVPVLAQSGEAQPGYLAGTVTDVNNDPIPGTTVVLEGPVPSDRRTVVTNDDGFFDLHDVTPGIPYQITISAKGFAVWTSSVVLNPGQHKTLDSKLQIEEVRTTVIVSPSPDQIATQQVEAEVKQRVFGIIPNFYVVYDPNPVPLTAKLKFKLAFKVVTDPITVLGIAFLSGVQQAGDTPNYPEGAKGYGERFGANAADSFTDIMIGGAILPSLLHQDPRYFYQGTGTNKSRIRHALLSPFVCKGDNGRWQPNYSSLGGDLASAAISNAYYPKSNRGLGLVFGNFATGTAEREVSGLVQEFVLGKITHGRPR